MPTPLTKSAVITKLKKMKTKLGRSPTFAEFRHETGITPVHIHKLFHGWNGALKAAGFSRSQHSRRSNAHLLEEFGNYALKVKRIPTRLEMDARSQSNPMHTCWQTFYIRFGSRAGIMAHLMHHWTDRPRSAALLAKYESESWHARRPKLGSPSAGFVYLMKSGPHYKIGSAISVKERYSAISTAIPGPLVIIHTIKSADTFGIERYWCRRFAPRRLKGEWFKLTPKDVKAFRAHNTM